MMDMDTDTPMDMDTDTENFQHIQYKLVLQTLFLKNPTEGATSSVH
jgi:hypothetical protein